jgi:molybdate transport system substrate-binding protein
MMHKLLAAVVAAAGMLTMSPMSRSAGAAELKVLASNGTRAVMNELGRQYQAATGHKLIMDFDVVAPLKRRVDGGEAFDVVILSPPAIDDLLKQGKVAADTRAPVGRTGLAVGTRNRAPKPDITSVEAFKRTMLGAKSVAYSQEGGSGTSFLGVLDRLGIAAEMKPKLKTYAVGGPVPTAEAELVVSGAAPILAMPDTELVGWLPSEIQVYVQFAGAVSATTREPEAAKALIRFVTNPTAAAVYKAAGLEQAGP